MDLKKLFKYRVIVARVGEMDQMKWWNTKGQLGPLGSAALKRGFPRTHHFAQARSVFAVAKHRCTEIFDSKDSVNLWKLPEAIEQQFEEQWENWIDSPAEFESLFSDLEKSQLHDLSALLQAHELFDKTSEETVKNPKTIDDGRALHLPGRFTNSDTQIALLAHGFLRAKNGELSVPYLQTN